MLSETITSEYENKNILSDLYLKINEYKKIIEYNNNEFKIFKNTNDKLTIDNNLLLLEL